MRFYTDELEIPFSQMVNKNLKKWNVKIILDIDNKKAGNYSRYIANAEADVNNVTFYVKYGFLGVIEDKIILPVFGPIPDTEIRCRNKRRSPSSKKPYKVCPSSFT
jgi:hypothetical protein